MALTALPFGALRPQSGPRWLLAGWAVLELAKGAALPGITDLFNLIPGVRDLEFRLYFAPSWEFAATLLAGFALNDWAQRRLAPRRWIAAAGILCLALAAIALAAGRDEIAALWPVAVTYRWVLLVSLAWGAVSVAFLALLLGRPPSAGAMWSLRGLVLFDGALLFSVPLFCAPRQPTLDLTGIRFLQQHEGLSRVRSLAALAPNYGAYFGVAAVDHNYLPVPQVWVDYIRAHLDPDSDGINFYGRRTAGDLSLFMPPDRVAAFEALAVRYVMAPAGTEPFRHTIGLARESGSHVPRPLMPGDALDGSFPPERVTAGRIGQVSVDIGTYQGRASGDLVISLCAAEDCASASAPLTGAADNTMLFVPFAEPLQVQAHQKLDFRIVHRGGDGPVAIWQDAPLDPPLHLGTAVSANGSLADVAPVLALDYAPASPAPTRVFSGPTSDIYELANSAPYFEAQDGNCVLQAQSREAVLADCTRPATLIRRELMLPGWRVSLNGATTTIRRSGALFQAADLPAGHSELRFAYAPPHIGWAELGAVLGLLGCTVGPLLDRFRRMAARRVGVRGGRQR